ncbi:MAG: type II secretion system inner membrane protein GspF [Pseudomonadales bacterium]|nr:type II secretion system inner membrane protein GspF [Pseudomonadales bacterium]MCP5214872.1 type II secretion system inner membrane protein GspF [Pseudomonadales bacterium]
MAAYDYVALDNNGRKKKGVLEADSSRQIRQLLRDKGWMPLEVDESSAKQQQQRSWFSPRISVADLALITRQLATLVQGALPLEESLNTVAQQTEKPVIRSMLLAVRARVLEGHSLAKSLAEFPRAFSHLYCATVAAGEQSGYLDKVLNRLADYTESSAESRQKIKLAILYPVILLLLSLLIVSGLMVYVVPDIVDVFVDTGQELPVLTRGLIALSDFLRSFGILLLLLVLAGGIAFRVALSKPALRLRFDHRLLSFPLLGKVSRGVNTARFASTLSILTSSAVPLVDALKISGEVLSNQWLKHKVREVTQQVTEGGSLHASLQQAGYFPPMMIHLIASGESSGELDQMLERVAQNQEREIQNFIALMLGLFEPFMLLFMGGCVLLIVLAILLPILNINQLVG